jgi:hypothetical protein
LRSPTLTKPFNFDISDSVRPKEHSQSISMADLFTPHGKNVFQLKRSSQQLCMQASFNSASAALRAPIAFGLAKIVLRL